MGTATSMDPTRATLQEDAAALHLVEFWAQRADIELTQPRNKAVPYCWRWSDIEPRLRVAAKTVPIEECERRALVFANPGLDGKPYITNTLFAAYSLYNPGERAPVHRHTPSASRFARSFHSKYSAGKDWRCAEIARRVIARCCSPSSWRRCAVSATSFCCSSRSWRRSGGPDPLPGRGP